MQGSNSIEEIPDQLQRSLPMSQKENDNIANALRDELTSGIFVHGI